MTEKQLKIAGVISLVLLTGGVLLYAKSKKNTPTTPPLSGINPNAVFNEQVLFITAATGVDKGLVSVGDKGFVDAWFKGLKAGADTFSYNGTYFNSSNGQQFS